MSGQERGLASGAVWAGDEETAVFRLSPGRRMMARRRRGRSPVVMACAWCRHFGRPTGAVRPVDARQWMPVSHAALWAFNRAGLASHGLCPTCRPRLAREWGLDEVAA
jgi:hypothetical protein